MECNGNLPDKGVPSSSSVEDLSDYTDADESISAPTEILAEVHCLLIGSVYWSKGVELVMAL